MAMRPRSVEMCDGCGYCDDCGAWVGNAEPWSECECSPELRAGHDRAAGASMPMDQKALRDEVKRLRLALAKCESVRKVNAYAAKEWAAESAIETIPPKSVRDKTYSEARAIIYQEVATELGAALDSDVLFLIKAEL